MKVKDIYQYVLGGLIVLVVFALVYVVFTLALPPANHDIALLIIGALIAKFVDVVNYFYGSSKSSQSKDDTISAALTKSQDDIAKSVPAELVGNKPTV